MVIAAVFRTPLFVQLASAAIGMPFFFLAGFAWPADAMPEPIRAVALFVPSTSAIDGFVRLSQLGASMHEVRGEFLTLWGLAFLYGAIAVLIEARRRGASGDEAASPLSAARGPLEVDQRAG